jgi:NitT/TauT family transport system substrate-binding protein
VKIARARMLALLSAAATAPAPAGAQAERPLRIGAETNETYGEALYGVDGGFFRRAGLNVEPELFASAGPIATAIAAGAIEVGLTDALVLANAVNRGVPLVAIAGAGLFRTTDPTSALCVAKSSSFRTAKSLEGQAVALGTLVSLTSIAVKMWLTRNGANVADVKFVEMPFSEMPFALQRGTVAAAYLPEPQLSQAGPVRIIAVPYSAIADTFLISLVTATRSWAVQNPDVVRRVAGAMYETARWANRNRNLTAPILAKYSKLEPDVIRHMKRTLFATALEPGMIQPILDAAVAYKLVDRPTNAADLILRP